MYLQRMKLALRPLVVAMLLVTSLATGLMQPGLCESQPRVVFKAYIKELYYATKVRQVSKFWIKNARVPMEECLGQAEVVQLAKLKAGYVYNPKITAELLDGNVCTLKGTGIAQEAGVQCRATLNVIMYYEENNWKIQYYAWQGEIPGHY